MAKVLAKAAKARPQPRDTRMSLGLMVEQNAAKTPDALMCLFEGKTITWGQFNFLAEPLGFALHPILSRSTAAKIHNQKKRN